MKKSTRFKSLSIIAVVIMTILMQSAMVFANETTDTTELKPEQLYEYGWEVTSTEIHGTSFGDWRTGPTGNGPGELNINESTTLDRSFTNTISGDYSIGSYSIGVSLGATIGVSKSHGTAYTIYLDKGERKTILYRPKITTHKVISTYYRYPIGIIGDKTPIKTETAYVDVFESWDYDWRHGY